MSISIARPASSCRRALFEVARCRAGAGERGMNDADPAAAAASTLDFSALASLAAWAIEVHRIELALDCERFGRLSPIGASRIVAGRVGERRLFLKYPCQGVLCLAESDEDRLTQLAAVLAVGSKAIWPANTATTMLLDQLPETVCQRVDLVDDWTNSKEDFDAVLHHGSEDGYRQMLARIRERGTRRIGLQAILPGSVDIRLDVLVVERFAGVE